MFKLTETASPTVVISDDKREEISPVLVSSKNATSCRTTEVKRAFRRRCIRLAVVMEKIKPRKPDAITLKFKRDSHL